MIGVSDACPAAFPYPNSRPDYQDMP